MTSYESDHKVIPQAILFLFCVAQHAQNILKLQTLNDNSAALVAYGEYEARSHYMCIH